MRVEMELKDATSAVNGHLDMPGSAYAFITLL